MKLRRRTSSRLGSLRSALLLALALGILAVLGVRISSIGGTDPGAVQSCIDRMREAEWATCRGEPYRAEALAALERDGELLRALVGPDLALDPEQLAQDLGDYTAQVKALRSAAHVSDEALWKLHETGTSIARACTEGRTHARTLTARWRAVFFGYLALLLCTWALGARRGRGTAGQPAHPAAQSAEEATARASALEARVQELEKHLDSSRSDLQLAREQSAAAAEASAAKSAFLANMSHEIRSPMTSILGFAEQLLDPGVGDDERVESIGMIRRNADHLMHLIDDVLDLSRIEAGELQLDLAPCALFPLLSEVRALMSARAARRGLEFRVDVPRPVPDTIVTDALRLKQVLLNLVGNAIKFTERGFVRVTLTAGESLQGRVRLCFRVEDTGIGMDEATLGRLFRPYAQADETIRKRFGGTGLGLSISAHIVERLGGKIEVQSRPQMGSRFEFTIEAASAPVCTWRSADALDATNVRLAETRIRPRQISARVLLAEDGEDNRRLIAHLLRRAGLDLVAVENGAEAVERIVHERDAGRPFDLVLMDMQMPVLDGYGAVRRLRELGVKTQIVALTANAMTPDRQRCLDAGCDEFCAKPIDFDEFFATLDRALARGRSETPAALPQARPAKPSSDDPSFAQLVELFVSELAEEVDALRKALMSSDTAELARLAHQLKGSCGSYGFPELSRRAAELERAAKNGASSAVIETAFAAFEKACASVRSSAAV